MMAIKINIHNPIVDVAIASKDDAFTAINNIGASNRRFKKAMIL